jgi:hypothetical protein
MIAGILKASDVTNRRAEIVADQSQQATPVGRVT